MHIDVSLVRHLIATQFPQWADLAIIAVEPGGWDNRTFRLGEHMLVRVPSASEYACKVEKENYWLPKLALFLPLPIPVPLAIGNPDAKYPWRWSIYQWIEGETVSRERMSNLDECAVALASFLYALHKIDTGGGPVAGSHNFYRGGLLKVYDAETKQAIDALTNKIDVKEIIKIWDAALNSTWDQPPVWVHGDIAPTNLLVKNGQLSAVIDFGGLGIGDPACDLVIAWTFFTAESRSLFRNAFDLDAATWDRARGWALWKALIVCAELPGTNTLEIEKSWQVLDEIKADWHLF